MMKLLSKKSQHKTSEPKIVVIGGGNGTSTLLRGLRKHTSNLTALVAMADSGGSTGVLRDELGVLPAGDARLCLIALANAPDSALLFSHRFDKGSLAGHNFGNIFLAGAERMTGSFEEALKLAGDSLRITGQVLPTTTDHTELKLADGNRTIVGEDNINQATLRNPGTPKIWLEPPAVLNVSAARAIAEADMVVIAPGLLYCSLAAACLVKGMREALENTKAKVVYVCNLVNIPRHTPDFSVTSYAAELERFIGAPVLDYVLYSTNMPKDEFLRGEERGVIFDADAAKAAHFISVGAHLVNEAPAAVDPNDKTAHLRASVRHDSDAVAKALLDIHRKKR